MDNPIQKIKLNKINGIRVDSSFFRYEHSYLSILPYLEKIGYPCSIIAVGEFSPELVRLIEADMDCALLIVNTDLLHCGPNYGVECPANPKKTNLDVIRKIISGKKIFPSLCVNIICSYNSATCGLSSTRVCRCIRCPQVLFLAFYNLSHLGIWSCVNCAFLRHPPCLLCR
jgi:hypothetical protein